MPSDERLVAWIEPHGSDFIASFVAASAAELRAPAVRQCASQEEARHWVTQEAAAICASVRWLADGVEHHRALD